MSWRVRRRGKKTYLFIFNVHFCAVEFSILKSLAAKTFEAMWKFLLIAAFCEFGVLTSGNALLTRTVDLLEAVPVNDEPMIGVLAQEISYYLDGKYPGQYGSYIAASYVKFVEGGGARAVPIW